MKLDKVLKLRKAKKYIKRTGSPGNYKYIYKEKKPVSSKEYMKEHAVGIRKEADELKRIGEEDFKRKKGEYDKKKLKDALAERKKKVVEKKMEVTLPQNVNTLTMDNIISLIKRSVKIPLKTLRRNQDIVEQQKEKAYKQKNYRAFKRLKVMGEIYTAAVDIKEFKDSTPEGWAEGIIKTTKQYEKTVI